MMNRLLLLLSQVATFTTAIPPDIGGDHAGEPVGFLLLLTKAS